jgi:5-oxoprolinase (ATP-hydrolysing) subunit A
MIATAIDLNADLGEDPAALTAGVEDALLGCITSANVACGGHAGNDATMETVVRMAREHGVAVGAHPGYPDRAGFGRVEQPLPPDELEAALAAQIRSLGTIARAHGVTLSHVKPHGALYHAAGRRTETATAIARAAARWSRDLVLVAQAGSAALACWRALGFATAGEAFADRRYEADGLLRARTRAGALLTDPVAAAEQAVRLARGAGALAEDGTVVPVVAHTLCLHADTPGAPALARAVRARLLAAGITIRPLPRERR